MCEDKYTYLARMTDQYRQGLELEIEKVRIGFNENYCKCDNLIYYAYLEYVLFQKDGQKERAERCSHILALAGSLSDEAVTYRKEHGDILADETEMTLDKMIQRRGRNYCAPMDSMFRPTYFLLAYEGVKKEGLIDSGKRELCRKAVERSIPEITAYLDWGPQNRGMIKGFNLLLAEANFPEHKCAKQWKLLGDAMVKESVDHWSIEDAQIYLPIWLAACITYYERFTTKDLSKDPLLLYYFNYIKLLVTPDGVIPDFGDARWLDSSGAYIYCLEKGASILNDGEMKYSAQLVWEKWQTSGRAKKAGQGSLGLKSMIFLADAMLCETDIKPQKPDYGSREIPDDLIGKKYRFSCESEQMKRYLMVNYRDEGDYAFLARHYIRNTIPVLNEKTHHGHGDENAIVLLTAGNSVLLHDGGYREVGRDKGQLPGHYRADFFHNKMVIRNHRDIPPGGLFQLYSQEPYYNKVSSNKVYFECFQDLDVGRSMVRDEKHGAIQNRTVVFLKKYGCYVICDTLTALREDAFLSSVIYFASVIKNSARNEYDLTTNAIASDEDEQAYINNVKYHLHVFFPKDGFQTEKESIRRHYSMEEGLLHTFCGHLNMGQSVVMVSLLYPQKGSETEIENVEVFPGTADSPGYEVRLTTQREQITFTDKTDLFYGCTDLGIRPTYRGESAAVDYGDIKTDALFSYIIRGKVGNGLRFGVINAVNLVYKGDKLFEVPKASIGQFDGSNRMMQSSWNRYEGEKMGEDE